ncbi:hypothetical protein Scep_022120 [Stephania cephalantha]|uniref:DYW domain-containing protein n=1 Tax=Stephania cephalantha TaxID=152367 RepID=A0AAP0F4R8_9MAGN
MALVPPSLSFHHHRQIQLTTQKPNLRSLPLILNPPKSCLTTQPTTTITTPPISQTIERLCQSGHLDQAFLLLQREFQENPDLGDQANAICLLLQSCGQAKNIEIGRKVHDLFSTEHTHLRDDVVLNTRLITMYSMCESPSESRILFDGLERKNLYQWNAMISGYNRNELWEDAMWLFCELVSATEFTPDNFTMPCVVKACGGLLCLELGKAVHGMAAKTGVDSDVFVGNALIGMYGKCGAVGDAVKVFEKMPVRNLVSWNAKMFVYSENGYAEESLAVFWDMMVGEDGLRPDSATLVTVLPVCAMEKEVEMGRLVHGLAVRLGLSYELMVSNALVDMYLKCGCVSEACLLFDRSVQRNVVSWNVMIGGCSREGDVYGAFNLLRQMQMEEKTKANAVTILNALSACVECHRLRSLKEIHGFAIRNSFQNDDLVANALVAAYAKCGSFSFADRVFYDIEDKTVSSWNALIGGYAQNGEPTKAVEKFHQMTLSGLEPDWFSIGSLLLACGHLKALRDGKSIHGFLLRNGLEMDSFVGISLLSLYIRCGELSQARLFFNKIEEKNLVCWNTMISGYPQNGLPENSINLFREMQRDGIQPSEIAIASMFSACAQLSASRLGKEMHGFVIKAYLDEDPFVGSSIVDMYAKSGCIKQSCIAFERLRERDLVSWTVMIAGYGIHGCGREAIELFERMQLEGFKPDGFTFIALLLACGHAGLVEEGLEYFSEMQTKHGIEPKIEHYTCIVDMLSRAAQFDRALRVVERMPVEPDAGILSALLSACRIHGNLSLGEQISEKLLKLDPYKAENYVLVSNLFARSGRWDNVRRLRGRMKEMGLKKDVGCSWVEIGSKFYHFKVGDDLLAEWEEIHGMWRTLEQKITKIGYSFDTASVLHELDEEEKVDILRGHSEKLAITYGLLKTKGVAVRVFKNLRMCGDCHTAAKLVSKVENRVIIVRDNKRFHHFSDGLCSCGDYW